MPNPPRLRDPRTGFPITEQQAIDRYGPNGAAQLAPYIEADPVRSDAPSLKSEPKCPGCGVATLDGGPCAVCEQKPQFQAPRGTFAIGAQPEPRYVREGAHARPAAPVTDVDATIAPGTTIGGTSGDGT